MSEQTKEEKVIEPMNVKVEIDYEKLALAIVTAQQTAKKTEEKQKSESQADDKSKENLAWWKKLWLKIKEYGTQNIAKIKNQSIITRIFSGLVFAVFMAVGLLLMFLSPDVIKMCRVDFITYLGAKVGKIYYYISFGLAEMAAVLLILAALEIIQSRNRQFIMSVFSALTSLVALIVAIIALFR